MSQPMIDQSTTLETLQEFSISRAYLRPDMSAAVLDLPVLARRLSAQIQHVHSLDFLQQPQPVDRFDALFAPLQRLTQAADPLAEVRRLSALLHPGGRLLLIDAQANLDVGELSGWLRAAGLVNLLLFGPGLQPARIPADLVALAVAARSVAGVHTAVQAGYRARALGQASDEGDTACCGPSDCGCSTGSTMISPLEIGYTQIELEAAPPEAAEISLGCGNPHAFADLRAGEAVLDIGSGGGLDSMLAARAVGPTGRVIGVDMTPAMLERARGSAARAGYDWIEYRQGQAEALPLEEASVDVALSNCVINLSPDKGLVFEQVFRVLKPGGRLEISDMVAGGSLPAAIGGDAASWSGCVAGALPESEYLALVEQAGFVDLLPRRSPAGETYGGVPVYSLALSARKPA